jgi:hypothetical protein
MKHDSMAAMRTAEGQLVEIFLDAGGRILCPADLIPIAGQYLLAVTNTMDSLLSVPIFFSGSSPGGFLAAPFLPSMWTPGTSLRLRGPLGHGFSLPASARRVALVAFDDSPLRLRGLIAPALAQKASVAIVSDHTSFDIPESVEIQPLNALTEACNWADYVAIDLERENLLALQEQLSPAYRSKSGFEARILVRTPMPCGALAECGVCAVVVGRGWKLTCKDGPVFNARELF